MTQDDAAADHRIPRPAGTAHLDQLRAVTERAAATAEPLRSRYAGAPDALSSRAERAVEAAREDLLALSADLHAHPEEGYAEHRSVRAVADLLGRYGVQAHVGAYGPDTALRATTGSGGPRWPCSPSTTRCRASATAVGTTSSVPRRWALSSACTPSCPGARCPGRPCCSGPRPRKAAAA